MIDHDFHFGFPFIEENDTAAIRLTRVGVERDWDHSIVHENSDKPIYTYIFQYTLEGSGIVEADGKKYVVNENDAFLLFMASDSRYYTNPESKIHWRYLYIMFIVDANIKRYCNKIKEEAGYVFKLSPNRNSIRSAFNLVLKRRAGLINHYLLSYAAAYDFICNLCYDTTVNKYDYSILIQDAIYIMQERYAKLSGITELAQMLNITASHLSREFIKEVGITPIQFLTKVRVEYALSLLTETSASISQIAALCGFESSGYFNKIVKKHIGVLPSEYRKIHKVEL